MERPNFNCVKYDTQTEIEDIRLYLKDLNEYCTYLENQNKQLRIGGVMRCYVREIDKFYEDTGYSDDTSDWGIRKDNKRKNSWDFKLPSQMIKDWMKWKRNNA